MVFQVARQVLQQFHLLITKLLGLGKLQFNLLKIQIFRLHQMRWQYIAVSIVQQDGMQLFYHQLLITLVISNMCQIVWPYNTLTVWLNNAQ